MVTLSACLIIKNEEAVIERCLRSILPICDQVVVVDTGSTDKSLDILDKLQREFSHLEVRYFEWIMDYSAARNYSFSFANSDYVMWVDADEYFSSELQNEILAWKRTSLGVDVGANTFIKVLGSDHVLHRTRIVNRLLHPKWSNSIHEDLNFDLSEHCNLLGFSGYVYHDRKEGGYWNTYEKYYFRSIVEGTLTLNAHNMYYFAWSVSNPIIKMIYAARYFVIRAYQSNKAIYTDDLGALSSIEHELLLNLTPLQDLSIIDDYYINGYYNVVQALCWFYLTTGRTQDPTIIKMYCHCLSELGAKSEVNLLYKQFESVLQEDFIDLGGKKIYVPETDPNYWVYGYYLYLYGGVITSDIAYSHNSLINNDIWSTIEYYQLHK